MSYCLNSLKRGYIGDDYKGLLIGIARSLDYGSNDASDSFRCPRNLFLASLGCFRVILGVRV